MAPSCSLGCWALGSMVETGVFVRFCFLRFTRVPTIFSGRSVLRCQLRLRRRCLVKARARSTERSEACLRAVLSLDRPVSPNESPLLPTEITTSGLLHRSLPISLQAAFVVMAREQLLDRCLRHTGGLMVGRCEFDPSVGARKRLALGVHHVHRTVLNLRSRYISPSSVASGIHWICQKIGYRIVVLLHIDRTGGDAKQGSTQSTRRSKRPILVPIASRGVQYQWWTS
jgi:hypothetical protein